ncbi:MAG: hypothetical protein AABX52_00260 [Nanoarchaeota archaeon]
MAATVNPVQTKKIPPPFSLEQLANELFLKEIEEDSGVMDKMDGIDRLPLPQQVLLAAKIVGRTWPFNPDYSLKVMNHFQQIFSEKVIGVLGSRYYSLASDAVFNLAGIKHVGENHKTVAVALELFETMPQFGFSPAKNQLVELVNARISTMYIVGKDALSPPPVPLFDAYNLFGCASPPPLQLGEESYGQKVHKTAWNLFNRYVSCVSIETGRRALSTTFKELFWKNNTGKAYDVLEKKEYHRFKMQEHYEIGEAIKQAIYCAVSDGDLEFLQALKKDERTEVYLKSSRDFIDKTRPNVGSWALKFLTDILFGVCSDNKNAVSQFNKFTIGESGKQFIELVGEKELEKHLRGYVSRGLNRLLDSSCDYQLEKLRLFIQTERGKQYKVWIERGITSHLAGMNEYVLKGVPNHFPEIAKSPQYTAAVVAIFDKRIGERDFRFAGDFASGIEGYLGQERIALLSQIRKKFR